MARQSTEASGPDLDFCHRIAEFCKGETAPFVETENLAQFGRAFTIWDGDSSFQSLFNRPCPYFRASPTRIETRIKEVRFKRVANTISEMAGLGHAAPLRLDMHDARQYGVSAGTAVQAPVVGYNRKDNAKNLVLWPLAPYHNLGSPNFVHPAPIDPVPFDEKSDIAVWRGNLTGRSRPAMTPNAPQGRLAQAIMSALVAAKTEDTIWKCHEELMGITRYNFVFRYHLSGEMDVALTLRDKDRLVRETTLLKPLCKRRVPVEWFFKSKYIFSLSGNDTGSNFLMAANSNAVVLKEKDSWELFYTAEFRPWEHYIPLERGAVDAEEKLAWARDNPKACKEMSRAAQAVCAKFASAENRRIYLSEILSYLAQPR